MRFHRTLIALALLAALAGCGGGGGTSTPASGSTGTVQPLSVTVNGTAVAVGTITAGQEAQVELKAGQDLELTANTKSVAWSIDAGNGNMITAEGTFYLGGMSITQKTASSTKWSATIAGASLTSQPATQTFKVIATALADGATVATVAVHAALPASSGSGWQPVTSLGKIRTLAIDPASPQTVYVQAASGVHKVTEGGAKWSTVNADLKSFVTGALAIDPVNSRILYAGSDNAAGLLKSIDGGASWNAINTGLPSFSFGDAIDGIAINPVNPQNVYVAVGFPTAATGQTGVFVSNNGGASWSATALTANVRVLAMDPSNPSVLYAGADTTTGLVRKTSDGGQTWAAMTPALDGGSLNVAVALAIAKANPQMLYLATNNGTLYRSADGGGSWSVLAVPGGLKGVTALAVDPVNPQLVYAGMSTGAIFRSVDGGANWTDVTKGQTSGSAVNALAIDPSSPATVYAGTFGLYKTTTGGQ